MSQDQITIIEPNGVERTRPMPLQGLTIGRGGDNNIVLGYDLISRYHARVTFDRGDYYVTDLNSANGTYLDRNRLAPNMPTAWIPGKLLRVGEVTIQLQQVTPSYGAPADSGDTMMGRLPDDTWLRSRQKRTPSKTNLVMWFVAAIILLCIIFTLVGTILYYFLAG